MSFLVGTVFTLGSMFMNQSEIQAEEFALADCCQELFQKCSDRFGWEYADSRKGPNCDPKIDYKTRLSTKSHQNFIFLMKRHVKLNMMLLLISRQSNLFYETHNKFYRHD